MTESSFQIFTSLRWTTGDMNFHSTDMNFSQVCKDIDQALLPYHRDRLLAAAYYFGWDKVANLLKGDTGLVLIRGKVDDHFRDNHHQVPGHITNHKLRIVINEAGELKLDSSVIDKHNTDEVAKQPPFIPNTLHALESENRVAAKVYINKQSTRPCSYTTYKTTVRDVYDQARLRLDISHSGPTVAEVLLWNQENEIMETSLCTPYFHRNGSWVTPSHLCGGNRGVTRRKALEDGLCIEGIVSKDEVLNGEKIWLSNAVRGFFPGQVYL